MRMINDIRGWSKLTWRGKGAELCVLSGLCTAYVLQLVTLVLPPSCGTARYPYLSTQTSLESQPCNATSCSASIHRLSAYLAPCQHETSLYTRKQCSLSWDSRAMLIATSQKLLVFANSSAALNGQRQCALDGALSTQMAASCSWTTRLQQSHLEALVMC